MVGWYGKAAAHERGNARRNDRRIDQENKALAERHLANATGRRLLQATPGSTSTSCRGSYSAYCTDLSAMQKPGLRYAAEFL